MRFACVCRHRHCCRRRRRRQRLQAVLVILYIVAHFINSRPWKRAYMHNSNHNQVKFQSIIWEASHRPIVQRQTSLQASNITFAGSRQKCVNTSDKKSNVCPIKSLSIDQFVIEFEIGTWSAFSQDYFELLLLCRRIVHIFIVALALSPTAMCLLLPPLVFLLSLLLL